MSEKTVIESVRVAFPFQVDVEGCTVTIIEVHPYVRIDKKRRYLVSCRVRCGNRSSSTFFLDVESNRDLLWKLKVEVSKFKILNLVT